jgi:hypothetical protein
MTTPFRRHHGVRARDYTDLDLVYTERLPGQTFGCVICPRVRGAHGQYRLWMVSGHHPGITRGRVNLAVPGPREGG